jgi:hypothetical protein
MMRQCSDAVLANPASADQWRALVGYIETLPSRDAILRAITAELIVQLSSLDEVLFGRMMVLLCAWAEGTGFQWEYCDVVGDRLLEAYRVSPVRIRCGIVLAVLELAVSHNRWHVMKQAGAMLGPAADNGLVDRILIEMDLDSAIEGKLRRVEHVINWTRDRWHVKIAAFLNARDTRRE